MSKKRKSPGASEILKVGNRVICLEGYLTKKRKTEPEHQPQPAATGGSVENASDPKPQKEDGDVVATTKSPAIAKSRRKFSASDPRASVGDPSYLKARKELPLWGYQDRIREILRQHDALVLEDWCRRRKVKINGEEVGVGGVIAITQPRRVAATTLAHRVSREVGTPITGQTNPGDSGDTSKDAYAKGLVGYSVRFDHNVPRGTKIKFLTEGMLLQELLRDPDLKQYSAVIVDEIHERSVDVDLLSGFLKQIHAGDKAGRGGIPLKLVIMSATANVEGIQRFFSAPDDVAPASGKAQDLSVEFLRIEGRQFPVDIIHTPKPVPDLQEGLLKTIFKIHLQEPLPGDILAFLIGQEEIEAAQKLIEEYAATLPSNSPKVKVLPLFGQLSIEAQHEAFKPLKAKFTRKIVLATNIAETSVTVPGVKYVVDCGKAKVKEFRTRLGMESLLAKPISKSSATQRAGRAGREAAGKCFRLYTEDSFNKLQDADLPEILRNDVLGAVLTMKARGIDDVLSFPLMDRPSVEAIEKALIHLHILGAIDDAGVITDMGRKMAYFPVSAPLGRVLLAAASPQYDCLLEVIDIISCITSGDDIFHQLQSEEAREEAEEYRKELYRREGDLITYHTALQHYAAESTDRVDWCKKRKVNIRNMRQAMNIRKQLRGLCLREKMLAETPPPDPQPFVPLSPDRAETVIKCFLRGFTLKAAMLAPDSSYVTTQGKHVVAIHPSSVLHGQKREAIMFLEHVFTQKNYAKKVSIIQANWIADALEADQV
ncbi:p-loop containing nucleoside triphosphate hydrolase protein [Coniochaeta hoffmannii]|uniref:RNA helicase n=1 Tax=Coniochaeta hoffmannii TaxID=91930 RepID=A0AA38RYZ7_9PEZI|nr:p-loop containing nucleoside triphosphate hydrolase protein [Coniochaeta hoffmannii]